jgi:hypothetical protein
MNNYWTTNFNAYQLGGHTWSYSITGVSGNQQQEAARAGQAHRIPFLARFMPGGGTKGSEEARAAGGPGNFRQEGSLISGWPENLLLISMIPEKEGTSALLHLRETAGHPTELHLRNEITGTSLNCTAVSVTGETLTGETLSIKPYESRFFRIVF